MKKILSLVFITVIIVSCETQRRVSVRPQTKDGNSYIEAYKDLAVREMKRSGVPASITLAQGMLESDYGRSTLAVKANNHFGIKCHNDWTGKRILHDDDRRNECFRSYRDVYESFKDHSDFLTGVSRYDFLFDYEITEYKKWARGLKKAGYATSPTYASKLIELIERYQLYRYDRQTTSYKMTISGGPQNLGNVDDFAISHSGHTVKNRNRIDYIITRPGDTFRSLTEEFDMLPWELPKYNELDKNAKLEPGKILYLQPKRNKAARGYDVHIVKEEDTLYSISQLYGIKLDKLCKKNHVKPGDELKPGMEIYLRKEKPLEEEKKDEKN
jgi:LysM repeat protein